MSVAQRRLLRVAPALLWRPAGRDNVRGRGVFYATRRGDPVTDTVPVVVVAVACHRIPRDGGRAGCPDGCRSRDRGPAVDLHRRSRTARRMPAHGHSHCTVGTGAAPLGGRGTDLRPHSRVAERGWRVWLRTRLRERVTWRELGYAVVNASILCWIDALVLVLCLGTVFFGVEVSLTEPVYPRTIGSSSCSRRSRSSRSRPTSSRHGRPDAPRSPALFSLPATPNSTACSTK